MTILSSKETFAMLIGSVPLLFLPSLGQADCLVCDELIEVTPQRASCFLERFDLFFSQIEGAPNGRSPIDLDSCFGGAQDKPRASLIDLPELEVQGGEPETTKAVYLLDSKGAQCLKELLTDHQGSFDPKVLFDLYEQCPNE